jgi:hypothetical protein
MNWVAANHYAMIVYEERLTRARTHGQGLDLHHLREGLSALRDKLAGGGRAGAQKLWPAQTARPSTRSTH